MGTPLLIVGASAGKLLPRAGAWMDFVKKLFGVMMLGVAAWMLARIVPERVALLLWAVPALTLAWLLWFELRTRSAARLGTARCGARGGLYGVALAAGSALGGTDPLAPIPAFARRAARAALPAIHHGRGSRARGARRERGEARRNARFLRRLVRLVQGDGALHVHRPGGAERPRERLAAARRCDRRQRRRSGAAQAIRNHRPPDHRLLRSRRPGAEPVSRGRVHEGRRLRGPGARGAASPRREPALARPPQGWRSRRILAGFGYRRVSPRRAICGPQRPTLQPGTAAPGPCPGRAQAEPESRARSPNDCRTSRFPDLAGRISHRSRMARPVRWSSISGRPGASPAAGRFRFSRRLATKMLEMDSKSSVSPSIIAIPLSNTPRTHEDRLPDADGRKGGLEAVSAFGMDRCCRLRCSRTRKAESSRSRSGSCIGTRRRSFSRAWPTSGPAGWASRPPGS